MAGEVENIVESTSPIVTRAEVLGAEQLRPSTLSIAEQIARSNSSGTPPKRRPGRPPGSGQRSSQPNSGTSVPEDDDTKKAELEARRIRALAAQRDTKKKKVDEYTTKIVEELNDNIMAAFVSMGVPSTVLYKTGSPKVPVVDPNYTPIANQLAVKPLQAKAIASFLVDLEYASQDSVVGKLAVSATSGNTALIFKGLLAAGSAFIYVKGVLDTMQKLGPILEQIQRQQEAEAMRNRQAHSMAHGSG